MPVRTRGAEGTRACAVEVHTDVSTLDAKSLLRIESNALVCELLHNCSIVRIQEARRNSRERDPARPHVSRTSRNAARLWVASQCGFPVPRSSTGLAVG